MKKLTATLLLVLTVLATPARASEDAFRHYTTRNGLASNTVQALIQDRSGLIWMGTANGLDSFDGREFIHHPFPTGENDYVQNLFEDSSGTLWIGTENAVFRYRDEFPERLAGIPEVLVTGFAEDRDGAVWISTWGEGIFRFGADGLSRFLEGHQVETLLVARDGRLWAADLTAAQGLSVYNAATRSFSSPDLDFKGCAPARVCAFSEDDDGDLWLGTWDSGLYRLNVDERTVHPAVPYGEGLYHVHTLVRGTALNFLVGSDDGLLEINPLTGERHLYRNDRNDPSSLSSKFVYPIVRDHEGGLWIGTYYGGVNYVPPTAGQFTILSLSDLVNGQEGFVVSCICEDADGTLWLGSDNGGLFRYDPVRKTAVRWQTTAPGTRRALLNIHALLRQGDDLWIGSYSLGLFRIDLRTGSIQEYRSDKGLDGNSSFALHVDGDGTLWAGTEHSLCRYDPAADRFVLERDTGDWVNAIRSDTDGSLWIATTRSGVLLRRNDGTWQAWTEGLPSPQVNCLFPAAGGMYAGTKKGLVLLKDGNAATLLPDEDIRQIISDGSTLWIGSNAALLHYHPDGGRTEQFGANDGIRSGEFSPNAGLSARDGAIWMGTTDGFVTFYPGGVRENAVPPPVLITRFIASGSGSSENVFRTQGGDDITLSWRQRDVRISFAALSYGAPEKIRYAYRLDGEDSRWNDLGNQNYVALNRLPAGHYRLQVAASNNSGVWNEEGASASFVIRPHPLLSGVALTLYILLIGALLFLLARWLMKREERKSKALYEQRLDAAVSIVKEEQRDDRIQFLSTLSDQLDAPLSGIGVQLDRLNENAKAAQPVKAELAVIEKNHRMLRNIATNLRQMRDSLVGVEGKGKAAPNAQEDFLLRLDRLITENLANPDLSVEFLAKEMAISRSGLFAKTKELCGETPNKLINLARLNMAAKLLSEDRHSIGEICYMTGFSSPSYFSKSFVAQFGVTPHEWVRLEKEQ